jgi:PAS domain S-box-containing protein
MAYDDRSARFRRAARGAALAATTIAAGVIVGGWVLGMDSLKGFAWDIPTKANTAACLLLCGVALFLLADPRGRGQRTARVLAGVAWAIGVVTLLEYAVGRNLGIDELVFNDTTHTLVFKDVDHTIVVAEPGRMAPQSAFAAVLMATALIGLDRPSRGRWPAGLLAAAVAAIMAATILGHVYGVSSMYLVGPFIAMSAPTAAGFLVLAIGISCARPERGVVAALTADTTSALMLRFLLPPALIVPLIVGTLVVVGEHHSLYADGEAVSLLVVATVFGCATFAIAAAGTLQSLDAKRRLADERLLDQTRRFRTLVERLPLVTYTDALDPVNTPIYVSPQVETTLGYTPEQWVSDPTLFERLLHADDRARVLSGIARFRETGESFRCEYRLRARDGRYVWVHDETVQVEDQMAGSLYAQGYLHDITERKAAEAERQSLHTQLSEAQRLESIGRLAGGLAHDFNNMLGAIIAYAGFARDKADDPELLADITQIRRAAEQGAEMTQQLLVFGRKDVVRKRVMDLNEAVTEATGLLRPLLGERHELRTSLAADVMRIEADPAQIQRILMNLVMNARAAMPGGGAVEVSTACVGIDPADAPLGLAAGRYVGMTVTDFGSGMSQEVVSRAFEPFFTTKPKGEGTGLGLAIVYGIATRLGGRVEIDSKPDVGTKVTLLLPAVDSEATVMRTERAPSASEARGEVVLVVDDDDALRRSTACMLSSHGYAVLEARDGVEGLARYRDADPPPAVLVTDVVMPGMTGPDLADAVAALDPRSRVVFMSGYPDGLDEAYEDTPLVAKPFTAEVLLTAVSEALATEASIV